MPRFVILTHDFPSLHWDLLLENSAVLRAWRLLEPPDSLRTVAAVAIPDHRLMYLDYEGPVSDGRGNVTRWDAGTYAMEAETPDRLEVALQGRRLAGRFRLTRSGETWTFGPCETAGS